MKKEDLNKAYWSCSYIESGITMQNVGLMFCCERENPGFVAPKEDPVSTYVFGITGNLYTVHPSVDSVQQLAPS